MANFHELITYFENLARTHVDIRHSDAEKHFFRMEIDEVLAGVNRTDVNFPMLIIEVYSFDFTDNGSDNLIKNRQGAFILLDHLSDMHDFDLMHDCWDKLEIIGTEILVKIQADKRSRSVPVVRHFDFSSVNASLIMNQMGNNIGIRFTYSIQSPTLGDVNPDKWLLNE
jgi:hypothetical protein